MTYFYEINEVPPELSPEKLRARLCIPTTLLQSGIDTIVYAEDALGIVHRVRTDLFDLQVIVPANRLQAAASLICSNHPYAPFNPMDLYEMDPWRDTRWFNES